MTGTVLRIDDRLVHGQVVEGWVRTLRIERLVVASDAVSGDEMQKALFLLAVPEGVELICLPVSEAAHAWRQGDWQTRQTMVLVSSPRDAERLLEAGVTIASVNVGGVHFRDGRVQVLKAVSLDTDDITALRGIAGRGTTLEARPLPLDEPINLGPYLDKWQQLKDQPR